MAISQVHADRLRDLWNGRMRHADDLRKHKEQQWYANWQRYRGRRENPKVRGQFWRQYLQMPDAFRIVESMVPQHIRGMFRNPNWFSVIANTQAGEDYSDLVRGLLQQGFVKTNGYKVTIEAVKQALVLGHAITKVTWDTKIGEREVPDIAFDLDPSGEQINPRFVRRTERTVLFNGPKISLSNPFRVWQDPTGQTNWVIEIFPESYSKLRPHEQGVRRQAVHEPRQDQAGHGQPVRGPAHLERAVDPGCPGRCRPARLPDSPAASRWHPRLLDAGAGRRSLVDVLGWVPPRTRDGYGVRTYDDTQWRLQVWANGEVLLRDVAAPTPDHRPPFVNTQAVVIPGELYGESPLTPCWGPD